MLPALPTAVRAGDTLAETYPLPEYPAPTWALHFALVNGTHKVAIACSAAAPDHALAVTAATTAGWVAGNYTWVAYVTNGTARTTLNSGAVQILPDLAAATTFDARTPARKALDAIDAALEAHGARAHLQTIRVGERQQTFNSMADMLAARSKLQAEVRGEEAAERMRKGLGGTQKLLVRFTRR